MKTISAILFCFACTLLFSCREPMSTLVTTDAGQVEGVQEEGFISYKGIPYAAPPVGDLRWQAPQPVKAWEGVLNTDTFQCGCSQAQNLKPQSEDCLYLNVWTPAKYATDKLPVMVWIHGGGFSAGAPLERTYFGEKLTAKGVIYVSVGYRLGPFGFLAHPELTAESPDKVSGNYGILDMVAALQWVQRNIAAFGGDPAQVTIFGESAGAAAVSILCGSPLAKGLFIRAISQSGANFSPLQEGTTLKGAEKTGLEFMSQMGVTSLAELRKMTPEQIFSLNKSSFRPVADGYVITGDQYKLYEAGIYNDVDVIIGSNSDEGGMFGGKVEPDAYKKAMQDRFGEYADRILAAYPGETEEQASYASMDITRETGFGWPGWTWARLQSRTGNSKVYMYYFEQKQPENTGRPMAIKLRGAPHAAEIKYVFKNIDTTRYSQDDVNLAEMMASYWTNFAKYGDPNGENLPVWPEFTEENQSVMYLKSTPEAGPVPHLENYQLMDEYFKTVRDSE